MALLDRLFPAKARGAAPVLYDRAVAVAREPHWYLAGQVPDTIDGRFDMIAAILSLVLIRLESEPEAAGLSAALAEVFIDDMDGQLREIGIGDVVVGKHIGKMMGMLGGRLGALRDGLAADALAPALIRNVYRSGQPDDGALAHVEGRLLGLRDRLAETPVEHMLAGELPQ